ncbi:hypothetical protein BH11MYX1_BH11MYX1_42100 [soil metagenome]
MRQPMGTSNIDELRFFLDGREELAPHVQAIGATVTDLMVAMSAEECQRQMNLSERAQEVCVLLEDAPVELSADDLEEIA